MHAHNRHCTHAHTHTRTHAHTHARTHTLTHTRTHARTHTHTCLNTSNSAMNLALVYSYLTDPSPPRNVTVTRVFQDDVELNWLPPTEPNGEVHYVVEYKREDSGNWTSVNTTNDSTHYNLTGLHNGTNYTIKVLAVTSGRAPIIGTTTSNTAEPTPMVCSTGEKG